jgi:putative zinc finger/helix-turn-helix YgiT family protein
MSVSVLTDERIAKWRCEACRQRSMRRTHVRYSKDVAHDGRAPVRIVIPDLPVIACTNPSCPAGHDSGNFVEDDQTLERMAEETYRQLGLLTPGQIREGREKLGLKQQELADLLGLGGNSLSRWENGRVYQARSMDTLLRIVFDVPEAVHHLRAIRTAAASRKSAVRAG